jgi:hypothetical protein
VHGCLRSDVIICERGVVSELITCFSLDTEIEGTELADDLADEKIGESPELFSPVGAYRVNYDI